jgi:hypothetical protein
LRTEFLSHPQRRPISDFNHNTALQEKIMVYNFNHRIEEYSMSAVKCNYMTDRGTLEPSEPHPAVRSAQRWLNAYVKRHQATAMPILLEAFASAALSGNRMAEICHETLQRVLNGDPISDRYYLGLVWMIREIEESKPQATQMLPIAKTPAQKRNLEALELAYKYKAAHRVYLDAIQELKDASMGIAAGRNQTEIYRVDKHDRIHSVFIYETTK